MGALGFIIPTIASVPIRTPDAATLYESGNGRRMVSVVVDFSQIPPTYYDSGSGYTTFFSYPEMTYLDASQGNTDGYSVVEFDLSTVANGIGLSEVRSVMAYCRPSYDFVNGDFFGIRDTITTTLLSNVASGQTVPLAGQSVDDDLARGDSYLFSTNFQSFPFFGSGSPIPIRILTLIGIGLPAGRPSGKFQLQFCNWDVEPSNALGFFGSSQ